MTYYSMYRSPSEQLAEQLETDGDYRVLRRLPCREEIWCRSMPVAEPGSSITCGILDTETTGLDCKRDQLIELALVKLVIDTERGDVLDVSAPWSWLEDPGEPLTPEIEMLTGLTDAQLRGEQFPDEAILSTLDDIDVLVSHNAAFDLGFLTKRLPKIGHPWACSAREVDWPAMGLGSGRSMGALLTSAGHFLPDAHRASPDTWALTCLLMMPSPDGRTIAAHLLDRARKTTLRLCAVGAPFEFKDALKAAGYRWCPERRAWWIEADPERIANEQAWLAELHPRISPLVREIDWFDRHKA